MDMVIELNPQASRSDRVGKSIASSENIEKLWRFCCAEQIDFAMGGRCLRVAVQADCHARLGDETTALACCARLPDDFWTPGIEGAPSGGKAEIAATLRSIAAEARRKRG